MYPDMSGIRPLNQDCNCIFALSGSKKIKGLPEDIFWLRFGENFYFYLFKPKL